MISLSTIIQDPLPLKTMYFIQRLHINAIKENKNLLGFGEYADKQLGALYKSYNSDNEFDELVEAGLLNAGDFVYDGINGQFRVLKQKDVS